MPRTAPISARTVANLLESASRAAGMSLDIEIHPADLQKQLVKFARSDLRLAGREGSCIIAQTRVGNVQLPPWARTVEEIASEFPEVEVAYQHIDAAMIHLVTDPGRGNSARFGRLLGAQGFDLHAERCPMNDEDLPPHRGRMLHFRRGDDA